MQKKLLILCTTCFLLSFSGTLRADDTELFGGGYINVPPNVLIVFDSSGSMGDNVTIPGGSGESYNTSWIYRENSGSWVQFQYIGVDGVIDSSEIACESARTSLTDNGHWDNQRIYNAAPHACGNWTVSRKTLATGTYLNTVSGASARTDKKINIAKETIADLINTNNGIRFGLMVFNNDQGGRVVAELATRDTQAEKDAFVATINSLSASGWTPLAETLAEAGRYYARQSSWFNSGVDYATFGNAIQYRCQKNYIIIMTDGESTKDSDHQLYDTIYLNNKVIGDYDLDVGTLANKQHTSEYYWLSRIDPAPSSQTAYSDGGSDYLDDVAKFLQDEDLLPATVDDASGISFGTYSSSVPFSKQNIVTYTIGFDTAHKLLADTADGTHGQGHYFTTQSNISLSTIFRRILGEILDNNSQFIAPVVPVNRTNNTYADNGIYIGIFAPEVSTPGIWRGNLKKFGFSKDGEILQRDGTTAAVGGVINVGAHSVWGTEASGLEGMTVDIGGVGAVLKAGSTRHFKTNKTGVGMVDFNTTNVLPGDMGLTNTNERDDLINFATASGIYSPTYTGADSKSRPWILGDIIHSQPAVLYDRVGTGKNVIFVGANDGFLHCFVDDDKGTTGKTQLGDDEVREAWAFIPWDLMPNLKHLPSSTTDTPMTNYITGDDAHDFFVDGSPEIYKSINNHRYVAFGLRRGGKDLTSGGEVANQYHILDVTNYDAPSYVTGISKNILGTQKLGQSWGVPRFCKIKSGTGQAEVLLLSGGFDTNQDNADPGSSDSKGRAVFAVDATDGSLSSTFNFNYNNGHSNMRYCMVDLTSYDDDEDECDDTIYAPSVGGDLFAYENRKHTDGTYGGWSNNLLFQAQPRGGSTAKLRKFFYAPGIAQELWGDFVYIGSGDREHPNGMTGDEATGTKTYERFYAIRNTWEASTDPISDNPSATRHLTDVSTDALQGTVSTPSSMSDSDKMIMRNNLATQDYGWFFDLERPGEKIVSTPIMYNKVVYFTTFNPIAETSTGSDPCGGGIGTGEARIYAVDYKTGEAVFKHFDGNIAKLTKEDRYKSIGTGIPSQPSIVVTETDTFILVGTEQGTTPIATGEGQALKRYFWLKTQ